MRRARRRGGSGSRDCVSNVALATAPGLKTTAPGLKTRPTCDASRTESLSHPVLGERDRELDCDADKSDADAAATPMTLTSSSRFAPRWKKRRPPSIRQFLALPK